MILHFPQKSCKNHVAARTSRVVGRDQAPRLGAAVGRGATRAAGPGGAESTAGGRGRNRRLRGMGRSPGANVLRT